MMTCECFCGEDDCNSNPPGCDSEGYYVLSQNLTYIPSSDNEMQRKSFYDYLKESKKFGGYMVNHDDKPLKKKPDKETKENADLKASANGLKHLSLIGFFYFYAFVINVFKVY